MVENEAKCCRSASRIKGWKTGAGRGVVICVLAGCSRRERREELGDPLDEKLQTPTGLLYEVHTVAIFRTVFPAVVVLNWVSTRALSSRYSADD